MSRRDLKMLATGCFFGMLLVATFGYTEEIVYTWNRYVPEPLSFWYHADKKESALPAPPENVGVKMPSLMTDKLYANEVWSYKEIGTRRIVLMETDLRMFLENLAGKLVEKQALTEKDVVEIYQHSRAKDGQITLMPKK